MPIYQMYLGNNEYEANRIIALIICEIILLIEDKYSLFVAKVATENTEPTIVIKKFKNMKNQSSLTSETKFGDTLMIFSRNITINVAGIVKTIAKMIFEKNTDEKYELAFL